MEIANRSGTLLHPRRELTTPVNSCAKTEETRQPHLQRAYELEGQNAKRMDAPDSKYPGEVFAIPDLYGPSKLLSDASKSRSFLFSKLKLDGLQLLFKSANSHGLTRSQTLTKGYPTLLSNRNLKMSSSVYLTSLLDLPRTFPPPASPLAPIGKT